MNDPRLVVGRSSSRPKWPSEMAIGTERDPDKRGPLVVSLASVGAAHVNGQVFHSSATATTDGAPGADPPHRGRPEARARGAGQAVPDTLGKGLHEPPGTNFGKSLSERPKQEWKDLGKGVRY